MFGILVFSLYRLLLFDFEDITRKVTYQNLINWHNELQEHRKGIPIIVVANKIDSMHSTSLLRLPILIFLLPS